MAYAINPWLSSPIQFNYSPATSVFPGGPTVAVINGFLVVEAGYRTNYEGEVDQPVSVDQFVFDFFGNLVSSQPNTTVNSTNPQSNPLYAFANSENFGGTTYANEFIHLGDTQNSN